MQMPIITSMPESANASLGASGVQATSSGAEKAAKSEKGEFGLLLHIMMANASKGEQLLSTDETSTQVSEVESSGSTLAGLLAALSSGENTKEFSALIEKLQQENPDLAALLSELQTIFAQAGLSEDQISALESIDLENIALGNATKEVGDSQLLQGEKGVDSESSFWQRFENLDLEDKADLLKQAVGLLKSKQPATENILTNVGETIKNSLKDSTLQKSVSNNQTDKISNQETEQNKLFAISKPKVNVSQEVVSKSIASAQDILKEASAVLSGKGDAGFLETVKIPENISLFNFQQVSTSLSGQPAGVQPEVKFQLPVHDPSQLQSLARDLSVNIAKGNSEMRITLKPEHLGAMKVKVVLKGDSMNMTMRVDSPQVKQMVEASLPQLREALVQHGIKISSFDVGVNDHESLQQGKSGEFHGYQSHKQKASFTKGYNDLATEETDETIELSKNMLTGSGSVNYLV